MKTELKKKWIEALRSGEYEQGEFCLRRSDKYCCLGVLADILPNRMWEAGGVGPLFCEIGEERVESRLPKEILRMRDQDSLINMNDCRGSNFDEIADWIEEEVSDES